MVTSQPKYLTSTSVEGMAYRKNSDPDKYHYFNPPINTINSIPQNVLMFVPDVYQNSPKRYVQNNQKMQKETSLDTGHIWASLYGG
jgi:hypothetical protein